MHKLIIFCASYLYIVGPVVLIAVWLRSNSKMRRSMFLRAIAVGILCAAFAFLAGDAYYEQRPFVREHVAPLISHAPDNGFPSRYTLYTFACAFVVWPYYSVAGVIIAIAGLIVGGSRVASLVDSPLDIVTSIGLAGLAALISKVIVRRRPKSARGINDPQPSSSTASNGTAD